MMMMHNGLPVATANYYHAYQPHPHQPQYLPHHHHHHHYASTYQGPHAAPPSLAFRPSLVQYQQQQQQQQQQLQNPPQQQQQLHQPTDVAIAAGFHTPSFRAQPQQHHSLDSYSPLPLPHPHLHRPAGLPQSSPTAGGHAMAFQQSSEEELAELQKLSNEYQPEITGPLVGQRQSSSSLANEYATADPVYQAKTANLPRTYSHYRTVRGDGACGWRAIAYGYLEALLNLGDANKFLEEETRLRSLNNVLNEAGFQEDLYEDYVDEYFSLMRQVGKGLQDGSGSDVLTEAFNDSNRQNYFIAYLRTLTAAWMRTHQADYAPWLLGQTIEDYCDTSVMPISSEMENVGLSALKDVLLSPAGIALEVLYLDRSSGDEANLHRFDAISSSGYNVAFLRLLYRPGHYDIIYKPEDIPPPPPSEIPTYLQYSTHTHHQPADLPAAQDFMTMIPGMSFAGASPDWMSASSYGSSDFFAPSAPIQQQCNPMAQPLAPTPRVIPPRQHIEPQPVYAPPPPTHMPPPPLHMPQDLVIRSAPHAPVQQPSYHRPLGGPFRSSAWELKPGIVDSTGQLPFQTAIFRNSHFNTAHFNNPDFQPEEWSPDAEYVTSNNSKSSRHKSSG